MKKIVVPVIMIIAISGIWGFQWKEKNRKVTYRIEIISLSDHETNFNATFLLSGESIRLNNQETPYSTTIEASGVECLIDAADQIRIVVTSRHGKLESDLKTAFIEADGLKKRILGM